MSSTVDRNSAFHAQGESNREDRRKPEETKGDAMTDEEREWAIKRIRAKRGFWVHLAVYLAVNTLLVFIWAASSGDYFWPVWPMLGWGIGVVAHGATVLVGPSKISEERIDRELRGRPASTTSAQVGRR